MQIKITSIKTATNISWSISFIDNVKEIVAKCIVRRTSWLDIAKLTWPTRSATRTKNSTDTSALVNAWKLVLLTGILAECVPHWTTDYETCHVLAKALLKPISRHIFVICREQSHRIARVQRMMGRFRGGHAVFTFRNDELRERGDRKHGRIVISWMVSRKLDGSFKRTGSECYTGAIMTVPPELLPGTLRCSAFLVGIDRAAAAIPFSSDIVCDPRIHVSESGNELCIFLMVAARGQHCAHYTWFA